MYLTRSIDIHTKRIAFPFSKFVLECLLGLCGIWKILRTRDSEVYNLKPHPILKYWFEIFTIFQNMFFLKKFSIMIRGEPQHIVMIFETLLQTKLFDLRVGLQQTQIR